MIEFLSDRITIRGPKVDGGYSITFDAGEYMQDKVAEIMKIPQQRTVRIIVDYGESEGPNNN